MAERLNTDGININRDEAVELMVHHLRLAALFFEVTPDDEGRQVEEEIARIGKDAVWVNAAKVFNSMLINEYEEMKRRDG